MTQDDIIRMAQEAWKDTDPSVDSVAWYQNLERFFDLVAAAQREKLAHWMRNCGYATGHGDTIEDLLDHLGTQISEGLEVEVLMEREAGAWNRRAAMNREDIIRMAREAGLYEDGKFFVLEHGELTRFAAIVAAAEREACAKLAESTICDTHLPTGVRIYGTRVAAAIRARGIA